jgi:hypothetical protein|tara:strand:+ start:117 stop:1259 length:1143 start_codon:yes stop_codon:yes gene_type:complete
MDEFKKQTNLSKLIIGSLKMTKEKLKFNIDDDSIKNIVEKQWNSTQNLYLNYNYDIKTLNNYCLTSIKNKITEFNNQNESSHDLKNNIHNDEINTNDDINNNIKIDSDFLDLKVKELEQKRNYIPDYDNIIINNNISSDESNKNKINNNKINNKDNFTTINYNTTNNIITFKSIILNSSFNYLININIYKELNIDYKNYKFFPENLYLPTFFNEITPFVKLQISDNNNSLFYNFTSVTNNKKWNTWKTIDNFDIDLNLNNAIIKLYDYNNKLLNLTNNPILINKVLAITKNNLTFYKLWCPKDYLYNFNNNFEINDIIMIKNNNGFNYVKKIIEIINSDNDHNIFIIHDDNNDFNLDNFKNSCIILLKNQFSLQIKYYIK